MRMNFVFALLQLKRVGREHVGASGRVGGCFGACKVDRTTEVKLENRRVCPVQALNSYSYRYSIVLGTPKFIV